MRGWRSRHGQARPMIRSCLTAGHSRTRDSLAAFNTFGLVQMPGPTVRGAKGRESTLSFHGSALRKTLRHEKIANKRDHADPNEIKREPFPRHVEMGAFCTETLTP
jgi:hypothetical protein